MIKVMGIENSDHLRLLRSRGTRKRLRVTRKKVKLLG